MSDDAEKDQTNETVMNEIEDEKKIENIQSDKSLITDHENYIDKEETAEEEETNDGFSEDGPSASTNTLLSQDVSQAISVTEVEETEEEDDEEHEPDAEVDLARFLEWCTDNGLHLSSKVKVTNEGTIHRYGLVATEEIKKGETLFRVPRDICLHSDNGSMAERLEDYELWLDEEDKSLEETSGWIPLLITLLYEFNKKDSQWAPYMRLVPSEDTFGHPMFWSEEERNTELKGVNVLWEVKRDIKNIEEEYYNYVVPFLQRNKSVLGKLSKYSLPLYKRLVAFVMSYSFTENQDSPSMVPMADMLNHASSNNAHLTYERDHLKMIALEKIEPGQEIFNTFGKLGNSELLQMYGYVETEGTNPYDAIDIPVIAFTDYIESTGKLTSVHIAAMLTFMRKWDMAFATDSFMFDKRGFRYGPDFLQFLRMIHMKPEEFEELLQSHASVYNDPTCQKLLRQIKLAKKTDTSSGVAVIDIDDSDDENETETVSSTGDKRKNDESELPADLAKRRKIENGLPFPNLAASNIPHGVPVIQQQGGFQAGVGMQHPSLSMAAMVSSGRLAVCHSSFFVNNTTSKGLTQSSAIMIDDDDSDDDEAGNDSNVEINTQESAQKDTNTGISSNEDTEKLNDIEENSSDTTTAAEKPLTEKTDSTTVNGDIAVNDSFDKDNAENAKSEDNSNTLNTDTAPSDKTETKDHSNEAEDESSKGKEDTPSVSIDSKTNSDNTETTANDATEKKDSDHASSQQNEQNSIIEVDESNKENINAGVIKENGEIDEDIDADSEGEEDDDLEFVGEDIRCQLPYDKLNQAMPSPWKETVKCVLRRQLETMKADDPEVDLTLLTYNQKMSRVVRQGQRDIISTFIASLT